MSEIVAGQENDVEEFQQMLRSLSPETVGLYAEAALGRDAAEFATSEVGKYMIGCARQDAAAAQAKLATVAAWRRRRVQELQNEIRVAEMFLSYLRDLAIRGKAAEQTLQDREE